MKPMTEPTPESTEALTPDATAPDTTTPDTTADDQPTITLTNVLKISGFADTGGEAKILIQNGDVLVNGVIETRRKRKLVEGDVISVRGEEFVLELEDEDDPEDTPEDTLNPEDA
jgi:ribosome-associated protein